MTSYLDARRRYLDACHLMTAAEQRLDDLLASGLDDESAWLRSGASLADRRCLKAHQEMHRAARRWLT